MGVPLPICIEKTRQPLGFLFHVLERPRLARRVCIHPQRLWRSRANVSRWSHSEVLRERALLLLEFGVNLIALGPGESIVSQAPWEEVEVDM